MMGLLSLFTGFLSPYISDILGYFRDKQNNAHELVMLQESNKSAREIADLNAQVGTIKAMVDDTKSARETQPSYGNALLDAVRTDRSWMNVWIIKPLLVWGLAIVEVANGLMRPYAIYLILTLWASTKVARFVLAYQAAEMGATPDEIMLGMARAIMATWGEEDWAALDYVLGFLLGSRHKLKEAGPK